MYRRDEYGSNPPRRESSGATLFALENEFPMPFGRAEIHGPAGYTHIAYIPAKRAFCSRSPHFSSLPSSLVPSSDARLLRGRIRW